MKKILKTLLFLLIFSAMTVAAENAAAVEKGNLAKGTAVNAAPANAASVPSNLKAPDKKEEIKDNGMEKQHMGPWGFIHGRHISKTELALRMLMGLCCFSLISFLFSLIFWGTKNLISGKKNMNSVVKSKRSKK